MTTPEQPYFVVKVTRCGECPHFLDERGACGAHKTNVVWDAAFAAQVSDENFEGITPTCPMWGQRVQEKKDE